MGPAYPIEPIADAFGFTLNELALNRAGCLAPRQRSRAALVTLLTVSIAVFLACVAVGYLHQAGIRGRIMALAFLVSAIGFGLLLPRAARDLFAPKVAWTEGPLHYEPDGRRDMRFVVGAYHDHVPMRKAESARSALPEGVPCGVHYLASTGLFLSIEPLGVRPGSPSAS